MHLQSHPPSTAPQSKPRRVQPARRRLHPCRVPSGQPSSWHARGPAEPHRADDTATAAFREWFSTLVAPSDPRNNTAEKHRNGSKRDFLEARQVSLFQLFDGQDYKFDVPAYQRPYSWGIKQVHEMLQDFLASYHAKSEYFMGAIVTVRGEDGPGTAMQVIDGQQRLTSLLIMLAFVHAWAKEQNNENLEARIKRMLYLEPDVLDPSAKGRFRLELRQGDDTFFIRNMLEAWLPIQYNLSGVAALQAEATGMGHGAGRSGTGGSIGGDGKPLENESWWRMYENAAYMRSTLSEAVAGGLNLQDFMFHVLRNCHVVLMTARDEAASFRIFSTINSRGMDLTMVDKLKADVLEVLEPSQRRKYATAWSEMEDILGRTAFHRVFDHMRSLAIVVHPEVQHMSVLEYFSRQRQDPALVAATIGCALDYAHTLLQLKQCRFEVCPPDSHAQTLASPSGPATRSVPHQLLAADGHGGIVASWDDGGPDSLVHTHGAVRMLERQARHMSLFSEDMWVPSTLDFFQQVQDMDLRTRFLQAAETLQLYLELCRDAGAAASRWQAVARTIIQRDLKEQEHLQAIFNVLVLSQQEKAEFRLRLNAKDLIGSAPRRTLAHLLLRAEGCAVSSSPEINFSELHVEKVVPAAPPEGSLWRRIKLGGANGTPAPTEPLTTTHAAPQASTIIPTVPNGNGSGRSSRGPSSSRATSRASSASSTGAAKDSNGSGGSSGGSPGGSPPAGTAAAGSAVLVGYSTAARAGSRRRSPGGEGVKYWFEVQRLFWHGKLGNLILLPTTPAAASPSLADADYDIKAAYYKSCGVEAVLPEWSGSVANGRYGRNRFSFEECKARHMDLHARLVEIFRLAEDDVEDPLEMEDEYWPDDSVY